MLNVIMLSVGMLNAVVPLKYLVWEINWSTIMIALKYHGWQIWMKLQSVGDQWPVL
jgi:hypothetical protein